MLGIFPKNPYVLKYLGGLQSHLQNQVMFFKPKMVDDSCVDGDYLENIGQKKGNQVGQSRRSTKKLPKRGRRSGKGEIQKYNNQNTLVQRS